MSEYEEYASSLSGTSTTEYITCLEIYHDDLTTPIRVVGDNQDFTMDSMTYTAIRFGIKLPDDKENQRPRVTLSIDNVGRELTDFIEQSNGGRGAQVRIMHVLRSYHGQDDVPIYYDRTVNLDNVTIDSTQVVGQLGYDIVLNEAATKITFRPDTAPGLY